MKLEQNVADLGYKVCENDEVEEIVKKRFDQYEANNTLTNVKEQTLSLKVRAQPNQIRSGYGFGQEDRTESALIEEINSMREEFTKA